MINRIAVSRPQPFPLVLKYTDVRAYLITIAFILLSVLVPRLFHQFHLAGPTYLPMHIFVLMGGLLFGWQVGLVVGLMTPLASYAVSGMPLLPVLPQVVVELSAYGLVAGLLRQKLNLRVIWSLLGAMIAGRLALFLAIIAIYFISGQSYSPAGAGASPAFAVWSTVRQGLPGIALQLVLVPAAIWLAAKFAAKKG